jgi:epoxyqueuosine reductase
MVERVLTQKIKAEVLNNGMDLVGFAPVSRWENAPYLASPQAILPGSKTVIVAALHITDTWTEMGGEPAPQDMSPGGWLDHNSLLDRITYRVVRLLEDYGHKAIGIAASNIWRYRQSEGGSDIFQADLSHRHAAVAAGLGEIGWSGLAITPEFGSRCRFVSIVTSAELIPTPMYDGPSLCDKCMECVKYCPSGALRKELEKPHEIVIEGKTFKYANKNKWRCAWAEHFGLDLDSENLKNYEHVGEEEILEELFEDGSYRGHERGVCQKVCVPPHLRSDEQSFGRDWQIAQNRINKRYPDTMPTLRKMRDDIVAYAIDLGIEIVGVDSINVDSEAGRQALSEVPGVQTVIGFAMSIPKEAKTRQEYNSYVSQAYEYGLRMKMHHILIRIGRMVEDYGYSAASYTGVLPPKHNIANDLAEMAGIGDLSEGVFCTAEFGQDVIVGAVTTDAPIDRTPQIEEVQGNVMLKRPDAKQLRRRLECLAEENLVSLFGVASVDVFDSVVAGLKEQIDEDELGEGVEDEGERINGSPLHGPWVSKTIKENVRIMGPKDYMDKAKSVIVLGMHFQDELIQNSGLEKTKQIGTYAYHQYQTCFELRFAAMELARYLNRLGYKTLVTENMLGIGSKVDTPRGALPDARCNAIEAVAAGLGDIGKSGALLTDEHGPHQRQIVIITDAEIPADSPYDGKKICKECGNCETRCTMGALDKRSFPLHIGNRVVDYPVVERHRCDWAKRYSLHKDEGPGLIGNQTHVEPTHKGKISIEELAAACEKKDQVMKARTCILEPCLRYCQAGNKKT